MSWKIRYAALCITGAVRRNNQDNLLLGDFYLPEMNSAMEVPRVGDASSDNGYLVAVFDGIGGAPHGETAAYIAARSLSQGIESVMFPNEKKISKRLNTVVHTINRTALQYREQRQISDYGCTVAGIWFDKKRASSFNVGDSRVYTYQDGQLTLISRDHTVGHGILSQYIGMEEEVGEPEPDVRVMNMKHGMQFLICSDGLNACMSDREIGQFFQKESGEQLVQDMMDQVKRRGAPDNTTIIWCQAV